MAEVITAATAADAATQPQAQVVNSHAAPTPAPAAGGRPTVTPGAPPAAEAKPAEPAKVLPKLGEASAAKRALRSEAAAKEQRASRSPGRSPAEAAAVAASAPPAPAPAAGLSAAEIAKAESAAADAAEARKVIEGAAPDFAAIAKEAQELAKTDPLAAMEKLGIPIDEAVRQALGKKPGEKPTREQELEAEVARLAAEVKTRDDKAAETEKARASAEQKAATVRAILADTRFPNLKTAEAVEAAFKDVRATAKAAEAERGRKLTDTEGDALVEYYLAKHNARLGAAASAADPAKKPLQGQQAENIKAGAIRPAVGRRSLAQVERERAEAAARER